MGRSIGKLSRTAPVLYHRTEQTASGETYQPQRLPGGSGSGVLLRLALVINRYKQLGSTCSLLFYTGFINYLAQTIKNLRGSL